MINLSGNVALGFKMIKNPCPLNRKGFFDLFCIAIIDTEHKKSQLPVKKW